MDHHLDLVSSHFLSGSSFTWILDDELCSWILIRKLMMEQISRQKTHYFFDNISLETRSILQGAGKRCRWPRHKIPRTDQNSICAQVANGNDVGWACRRSITALPCFQEKNNIVPPQIDAQIIVDTTFAINRNPAWDKRLDFDVDDLTAGDSRETQAPPFCTHGEMIEGCEQVQKPQFWWLEWFICLRIQAAEVTPFRKILQLTKQKLTIIFRKISMPWRSFQQVTLPRKTKYCFLIGHMDLSSEAGSGVCHKVPF